MLKRLTCFLNSYFIHDNRHEGCACFCFYDFKSEFIDSASSTKESVPLNFYVYRLIFLFHFFWEHRVECQQQSTKILFKTTAFFFKFIFGQPEPFEQLGSFWKPHGKTQFCSATHKKIVMPLHAHISNIVNNKIRNERVGVNSTCQLLRSVFCSQAKVHRRNNSTHRERVLIRKISTFLRCQIWVVEQSDHQLVDHDEAATKTLNKNAEMTLHQKRAPVKEDVIAYQEHTRFGFFA